MNPVDYIVSFVKGPKTSSQPKSDFDFDCIGRYHYNNALEESVVQFIDAETTVDLDLNAVFERIDRTDSKVGQQVLYARLRTLRGENDAAEFSRRVEWFAAHEIQTQHCRKHLARLAANDAYDLQNLIFDTPPRIRRIGLVYVLTFLTAASLIASFFHPLFLLLFAACFACNLSIHYGNKINVLLYASAQRQLSRAIVTARALADEQIPGSNSARPALDEAAGIDRRGRMVGMQGDSGNDLFILLYLLLELVKIAFNVEVILFHRFIGGIVARRDAIHDLFRFIGTTDAAISVMRLRGETPTCRPVFIEGKYLEVMQARHPLIDKCVANTLILDSSGLLLSGSNMSGKTTFIRTLALSALLAQTIGTCFAESYTAPYMRLYTSIRIADDLSAGTSYYLEEVLTVKRFLDAARAGVPCLFALDELFKGTNTTERIAAGKAVLATLNRGPHIVLAATHDTELIALLRGDGFEAYHFREEIADGALRFDYQLHAGQPSTRNAIRILELYDYPPQLIAEAYETQEQLLEKST